MTREEISHVLAHYDLGELRACRRVEHGYVNDNWIVETTTGQYFLKRRHPSLRKPRRIRAQHVLIRHLRSVHFPAPAIIPTRAGNTFLEHQGEIYEIHSYVAGQLCDIERPAHLAEAAHTLGWYHTVIDGFDHREFHRSKSRYSAASLARILDRLTENLAGTQTPDLAELLGGLRAHARDLAARFTEFGQLPELVIHGDFYAENLIFQGDRVAGVVDYDLAQWSWQVLELAEAVIYFATQRQSRLKHIVYSDVLDLGAVHRFLVAYDEARALTDAEITALPHFIRTIWLCASLDPPLGPQLDRDTAPEALPEVLTLAGWAEAHASDLVEIGFAARTSRS